MAYKGVYSKKKWNRVNANHEAFMRPTKAKVRPSIAINLTHGKTAYLTLPEGITENDIKIIQHHLQGMIMKIQMDQK